MNELNKITRRDSLAGILAAYLDLVETPIESAKSMILTVRDSLGWDVKIAFKNGRKSKRTIGTCVEDSENSYYIVFSKNCRYADGCVDLLTPMHELAHTRSLSHRSEFYDILAIVLRRWYNIYGHDFVKFLRSGKEIYKPNVSI